MIDTEARANMKINKMILTMKYYYRLNKYDEEINWPIKEEYKISDWDSRKTNAGTHSTI